MCLHDGKVLYSETDPLSPKQFSLPLTLEVVQVACGKQHVLLRTREGELYTEGKGPQTGFSENNIAVPTLLRRDVDFIAAGEEHSLAIITFEMKKKE